MSVDRRTEIREKAPKDLQQSGVLSAALAQEAGRTALTRVEICDGGGTVIDLSVPNILLAEHRATKNYTAANCPLCGGGVPITSF